MIAAVRTFRFATVSTGIDSPFRRRGACGPANGTAVEHSGISPAHGRQSMYYQQPDDYFYKYLPA
jgi:hypothetical protein